MGKEAGNWSASGVRGCSHATAEAVPAQATGGEGAGAATTPGAERPPHPGPAASARQPRSRARAPAKGRAQASAPSGEEEAHRAVHLVRRAVHDSEAPEAARAGAEAPEQGGLPRRGDERAVPRVQRAPLQRAQRRAAQRREAAPPATQRRSLRRTVALQWQHIAYELHVCCYYSHYCRYSYNNMTKQNYVMADEVTTIYLVRHKLWAVFVFVAICS